jgi:hypothetical protein
MPSLSDIGRHLRLAAHDIDDLRIQRLEFRGILSRLIMLYESVEGPFSSHSDAEDLMQILVDDARDMLDSDLD